jgi:phage terminase small subunit
MKQSVIIVPLLDRHKKFADEYLRTNNATAAYRLVYPDAKAPHVSAHKWLKRPDITEYLAHAAAKLSAPRDEAAEKGRELDNRVIQELSTLAFANIADLIVIDSDGQPSFDLSKATREQLSAIANLKTKTTKRYDGKGQHVATDTELAISIADKYRGLELLGKHRGLFKADEQRVVLDVADRLLNARRRVALLERDSDITLTDGHPGGGGA